MTVMTGRQAIVTTPPLKGGGFCANAEPNGLR